MLQKKHASGPYVVYLDQCALSRFLKDPNDSAWDEACSLLDHGARSGAVVCPRSLEHLVESSQLADAQSLQLLEKIEALSQGWDLRLEPELVAQQIIEHLRGLAPTYSTFLAKGVFRNVRNSSQLQQLRTLKSQVDRGTEDRVAISNHINAAARDSKQVDAALLATLIRYKSDETVRRLSGAIERSLKEGFIRVEADPFYPNLKKWDTVITYHLITDHHLRPPEAIQLLRILKEKQLAVSATLFVKTELDSLQFARRERILASDQYDITHAACALPYADIFVTDGGKAAAIRERKLDERFHTTVFSTRASEIPALTKALRLLQ